MVSISEVRYSRFQIACNIRFEIDCFENDCCENDCCENDCYKQTDCHATVFETGCCEADCCETYCCDFDCYSRFGTEISQQSV